jgi:ubiquinone/menaquinone biosynthesis C-methylase UbiE
MIRTRHDQINTKVYWNYVYSDFVKREEYDVHGTLINPARIGDVIVKPTARFLDIGCGVGTLTKLVKKTYPEAEVWGVDISDKAIEDNKTENASIKYEQGYVGSLELPEDYFDVIFSGEVIEHLDEPTELFAEAYRFLKKGGTLIITTPIENHVDSSEHVWMFDKDDIKKFHSDAGFTDLKFHKLPDLEHMVVFYTTAKK